MQFNYRNDIKCQLIMGSMGDPAILVCYKCTRHVNARYAQKERTSVLDRVINFNIMKREDRRTRDDNDNVEVGGHVEKEKLRSVPLYAITPDIFPCEYMLPLAKYR